MPPCSDRPTLYLVPAWGDMNILLITYGFEPIHRPQTFVILKWLKYLSDARHDITVLSVDPHSFRGPVDVTLHELVPENVQSVRAPSRE